MTQKIIRLPKVMEKTGLARSTIYLLMSQGKFPKSIQIGERAIGWVEEEIDQWIADRIAISKEKMKESAS